MSQLHIRSLRTRAKPHSKAELSSYLQPDSKGTGSTCYGGDRVSESVDLLHLHVAEEDIHGCCGGLTHLDGEAFPPQRCADDQGGKGHSACHPEASIGSVSEVALQARRSSCDAQNCSVPPWLSCSKTTNTETHNMRPSVSTRALRVRQTTWRAGSHLHCPATSTILSKVDGAKQHQGAIRRLSRAACSRARPPARPAPRWTVKLPPHCHPHTTQHG